MSVQGSRAAPPGAPAGAPGSGTRSSATASSGGSGGSAPTGAPRPAGAEQPIDRTMVTVSGRRTQAQEAVILQAMSAWRAHARRPPPRGHPARGAAACARVRAAAGTCGAQWNRWDMGAPSKVATEADFEAVWPVLALALGDTGETARAVLADRYLRASGCALWALMGGAQPVTAVVGVRCAADVGEILHIAVAPGHRRAGVGSMLVRWLCRQRPEVRSWRAETDDDAVGFYRRLGFSVVDLGERYPGRRRYACTLQRPAAGSHEAPAYCSSMDTQQQAGLEAQSVDAVRAALRHLLATIAYRTRKCLAGAPPGFGQYDAGAGVRRPAELVDHLTGLCCFAQGLLVGSPRRDLEPVGWDAAVQRLEAVLRELDGAVAAAGAWHQDPGMAVQGPLADALTHVGQLAMLRRLAGSPIDGENYARAPIRIGELSLDGGGG